MSGEWLILAVAVPLLAAVAAMAWPARATALGLLGAAASTATVLYVSAAVLRQGTLEAHLGGWTPGLGIALRADALTALLLVMSALVAMAASVYASAYFGRGSEQRRFWPLWLMLWTALNALFLAADLFNLYVTLELLGLAAVAPAALGGSREAVSAALRYLLVGLAGSMAYLGGVALLYVRYGSLDLATVAGAIGPEPAAWVAMALMLGGLLVKTALFPLHFWLPPAHASAPAPVSAALSALVVKAAFYLVLRLWLELFPGIAGPPVDALLGALGAIAVVWGSWQALRAERLKLLAAYSTVAQLGYLFLAFPLLGALPPGEARDTLFGGVLMLALTHGFAKSGLFLAAGTLMHHGGHDRIGDLGGTAQRLPATTFTIALAGFALVGLPPSGAFLGKWQLLSAAVAAGAWWSVVIVAVGSLLATAYLFRVLAHAFGHDPVPPRAVTAGREEWPALLLALTAAVALGLAGAAVWPAVAGIA